MKVVGLIVEYNPFHNGHLYHVEQAKKITGAEYVIAVMSGNFVQRGSPALMDKYTRARMALSNSVDLVIELPVCYATSSAEYFALGAISILDKLGIVDYLCFGSECGDISLLTSIANVLNDEPDELKKDINTLLKTGQSFPKARMNALINYEKTNPFLMLNDNPIAKDIDTINSVISSPNNILGVEYIKALLKLKSNIIPYTIKRIDANYHDKYLNSPIASATAIRRAINNEKSLTTTYDHIPNNILHLLNESYNQTMPIVEDDFSLPLYYKLLSENPESLLIYLDITHGLNMRIEKLKMSHMGFSEFAKQLKTKQFTLTRINRGFLHILLGITKDNMNLYKDNNYTQYARILGFKKSSSHLIKEAKEINKILIITKLANARELLSDLGNQMLNEDIFASNLYNRIIYEKFKKTLDNDYIHRIEII